MHSYYQAYQSFEKKVMRGEYGHFLPAKPRPTQNRVHFSLTYRLGTKLVHLGLKMTHQARAGHALTITTRAEK